MGASAIVGFGSAKSGAKAQQNSLLTDAYAADRSAQVADNSAIVSSNNAALANWQGRDTVRLAEGDVSNIMADRSTALASVRNDAANVKSAQKTSFAANGVDVGQGSAADVLASTDYVGELNAASITDAAARNAQTTRDNAIKTAWGYTVEATNYTNQAAAQRADAALYRDDARRLRAGSAAINPRTAGLVSLLGSAGQVSSAWYASSKGGK